MFSKPVSLILVYILTIINFCILSLPLLAAALLFASFENGKIIFTSLMLGYAKAAVIFLIFLISFLMLLYLFLDFIFGFSYRAALKGAKRFEEIEGYKFLGEIFSQVKKKFAEPLVRLYVRNSKEINAFAVASIGRRSVVLTSGLINHYLKNSANEEEFFNCMRSLISHEMSHLVNKDFIAGLLIITNQKVTNLVSQILETLFYLLIRFLAILRINNRYTEEIIILIYKISDRILTFFNRYVVYNLYEFLRRYISRGIEYRCDRQAAQAFGGRNMAIALAMLGDSGYFTIFSTHPRTRRRVSKVQNIQKREGNIRPSIINSIANYFSWMTLVIICLICAKISRMDIIIRQYLIQNHQLIYKQIIYIISFIKHLLPV